MSSTYLDYFNYYLREFLNEIVTFFPDTKNDVLNNYRQLLENKNDKSDLYVKFYVSRINNYLCEIAKRDNKMFETQNLFLLEGLDFNLLWNKSTINETNKTAIWKYLQLLTLLGRKIVPNKNEIIGMLQKVGTIIEEPDKLNSTLGQGTNDDDSSNPLLNLLGLGGGLGGLGELGGLFGSEGLGDVISGMQEMASGVNTDDIMKGLSEGIGNKDNSTPSNVNILSNSSNVNDSATTNETLTISDTENNNGNGFDDMLKDMASELEDVLDINGMDEKEMENMSLNDIIKKIASGDNSKKIGNVIGKSLKEGFASGKVKGEDLLKQSFGMMSQMGQMNQQMNNLGLNRAQQNRVNSSMRNQSAREKLKAKYEKRQLQQQNK